MLLSVYSHGIRLPRYGVRGTYRQSRADHPGQPRIVVYDIIADQTW